MSTVFFFHDEPANVSDHDERLRVHAAEPVERVGDGDRARAGHLEAAGREVVGLARGERQRPEEENRPHREEHPATARDEPTQPIHRPLHV
jgi:hypothetical protein